MALLLCVALLFMASMGGVHAAKGCNQLQVECSLVVGIGNAESCLNRCNAYGSVLHDKATNHCLGRDGMTPIVVKVAPKFTGNPTRKVCTCYTKYTVWRLSRGCDVNNYATEVCINQAGGTFGNSDISEHNVWC